MNRGIVVIAGGALALAAVGGLFVLMRPEPAPVTVESEQPAPAAAPVTTPLSPRTSPTPRTTAPGRAAAPQPSATPTPEAKRTTATILVESDVPDTSVFVNRTFKGTAPMRIDDLAPGTYQINLSPQGYEGVALPVEVTAGEEKTLSWKFREIRLNERIAVTHKHAFGSCSGTLVATPRGLSYETTHQDAFTAPLTALDTFDVNYVEKNLRLKVAGKTYNFADAEGNADRLYLFHQNVDKVRKRLMEGKRP